MNIHAWHVTTTGRGGVSRTGREAATSPRRGRVACSAAGAAMLALAAAGCTGGGAVSPEYEDGPSSASAPHSTEGASSTAVVGVAATDLGKTLVDGRGRTLYLFEADKDSHATCDGACAGAWPPYVSRSAPKAGPGVNRGLISTSARAGSDAQVTYRGHPLYYFSGDRRAGDTTGQGKDSFGAAWYVLGPSGLKIDRN